MAVRNISGTAGKRTVFCPGIERSVPLKTYLAGVRLAKANPDAEFKTGITCWWPCTGREIVKQFFAGVQDRINQAIPYVDR